MDMVGVSFWFAMNLQMKARGGNHVGDLAAVLHASSAPPRARSATPTKCLGDCNLFKPFVFARLVHQHECAI